MLGVGVGVVMVVVGAMRVAVAMRMIVPMRAVMVVRMSIMVMVVVVAMRVRVLMAFLRRDVGRPAGAGADGVAERAVGRRADPLDMMVMALLGEPDLGLEAQNLLAIFAHLAVHVVGALEDLAEPVDEGLDHEIVRAEIGGLEECDVRMALGHEVGLIVNAPHQDPGEQEIGKDDDPLVAETARMFESRARPAGR